MAAETIAAAGARVTVFDAMPSVGRKFLMAGRGGLNLTHSEALELFMARYGAASAHLDAAIASFPPQSLRDWSAALGQDTFVGSSGRVFPQAMKASPLLRGWLARLDALGVSIATRHRWQGWDGDRLVFNVPSGPTCVEARVTVLALGGASWPRLGSDGAWTSVLAARGIAIAPLQASNCGFLVQWSDVFRERYAGQPLKNIALAIGGRSVRGEIMLTEQGIEGNAVYALSADLRDAVLAKGRAVATLALRPDMSTAQLAGKLDQPRGKQSLSNVLRKQLHLSPAAIGLLQEMAITSGVPLAAMSPRDLAASLNAIPLTLSGIAPIDRAISTAGGVRFDQLDELFMLRDSPGTFVCGEMLDWDAPTGGYLLQASFATGRAAGLGVLEWLKR
jgi:uncharacterized flavoprotein (TIGR03862 family)